MIIDIPKKTDFYRSGFSMLNLAWDSIMSLYLELEDSQLEEWDDSGEETEEYWRAAQYPISVAIALAQQGIELLLKGRIADVSPFLLLVGNPREWPKGCNEKDTPFADFRTIDAHDLMRTHDCIVSERLKATFKTRYEYLRRLRNTVFHSVDKNTRTSSKDVIEAILEAVDSLAQPESWINIRRDYLENNPTAKVYSADYVHVALVREFTRLISVLSTAELKRFFKFNKRQRLYVCLNCLSECKSVDVDCESKFAILSPNTPKSKQLYCPLCDSHTPVIRKNCSYNGCKGNVLALYGGSAVCVTCDE